MRRIALWLLRFLERELDDDLKQRLKDYQAERERVQRETLATQQALARDAEMLTALKQRRSSLQEQVEGVETEIANLREEARKIDNEKTDSATAGDPAVLRGDL
jgi:chromosome segregation ATPase